MENQRFNNYKQLLLKVESHFSKVQAKHEKRFQCKKGCFGCCKSGLTVTNIEQAYIHDWLNEEADRRSQVQKQMQTGRTDGFCKFLDSEGGCLIYEARPLICRSHGMPVSWEDESDQQMRDCCPLNFTDITLDLLEATDVLPLEHVNVLLSLIDRQYEPKLAGERVTLDDMAAKILSF